MKDVKTLDSRIREKAVAEAKEKIAKAIGSLENLMLGKMVLGHTYTKVEPTEVKVYNGSLLAMVGNQFLNNIKEEIGNAAVQAFMERVENLGNEIEQIKQDIQT